MAIEQHWLVNGTHYQKTLGTYVLFTSFLFITYQKESILPSDFFIGLDLKFLV